MDKQKVPHKTEIILQTKPIGARLKYCKFIIEPGARFGTSYTSQLHLSFHVGLGKEIENALLFRSERPLLRTDTVTFSQCCSLSLMRMLSLVLHVELR